METFNIFTFYVWLSGVEVGALDLRSTGRTFDFQAWAFSGATSASQQVVHTYVTEQYKLLPT